MAAMANTRPRSASVSSSTSSTSSSTASSASTASSSGDERGTAKPRFLPVPPPQFSAKVAQLVTDAKRRHRTDIKPDAWNREGFAGSDVCELPLDESNPIKREHASELTVERFIDEYEKPYEPVVIEGVPEVEAWGAATNWTLKKLRKKYKRAMLKCGEDDDGKTICMKFKYFVKYMKQQTDDSPLYIFDSSFDDREDTKPLLADYRVPKYFPENLFALVGEDRRPPYRWFLVGPKRSGTCVHLDPLGTSAWNTLLVGRKRWVLFPPDVPKRIVKGKDHIRPGEDDEAVNYFMDILPRIKKAHSPEMLRCVELMQYPGDTIFVPGGWWHAVFNVEDTVAVTENFCSSQNFDRVWRATRSGRKRMAIKWLKKLHARHPHLAERAVMMNRNDGFVMYDKDGTPFELGGSVQSHHTAKAEPASDLESTVSSVESSMAKKAKKKTKTKRTKEEDDDKGDLDHERAELGDSAEQRKSKKQKKSRMD